MPAVLREYQAKALRQMKNGCILNGGVGSGKSLTAVAYYYLTEGGKVVYSKIKPDNTYDYSVQYDLLTGNLLTEEEKGVYKFMDNPRDLYIITTPKKRDEHEWNTELAQFFMSPNPKINHYKNKIVVDSWNNITKYVDISNAFFIFDEQRTVGYGVWSKSFIKIARNNKWILLSATPGDDWDDFMSVFIANGFYRNKSDFDYQHTVYSTHTDYPSIDHFINEGILMRHKLDILVPMPFERCTNRIFQYLDAIYDKERYMFVQKNKWNIYEDKPIESPSELCYVLRKIINSDPSRGELVKETLEKHPRLIIFYSYDYELEQLKKMLDEINYPYSEWNGHKHQPINTGDKWVYIVQYTSGCEGWNCVTTNAILFHSLNYSYKVTEQACGRIDRLNTPYKDLYYYTIRSHSIIDCAILAALHKKKKFNENRYEKAYFDKMKEAKRIIIDSDKDDIDTF